tara:strand:+ start:37 stop:423 length:387 start_codon:yes stop_codon:yes gene_type:complete
MAFEYHGIVYDTDNERLARVVEAIRQRQKQDDPFRIKVTWGDPFIRPYSGYIVHTEPSALTEWDTESSAPLLAWNRRSRRGVALNPFSIISKIEFASKSESLKAGPLYLKENNYINAICDEWLSAAIF